jgi:LacI family transcriptional regulator
LHIETLKVYHSDLPPDPAMLAQTAGLICIGLHDAEELDWLKTHARHVVCADFTPADDEIDAVESDLPAAMRKLLVALTKAGYQRIGFVGWWDQDRQGKVRQREKRCATYMDWMQA